MEYQTIIYTLFSLVSNADGINPPFTYIGIKASANGITSIVMSGISRTISPIHFVNCKYTKNIKNDNLNTDIVILLIKGNKTKTNKKIQLKGCDTLSGPATFCKVDNF